MNRRQLLKGLGVSSIGLLAGCTANVPDEITININSDEGRNTPTPTETSSPTPTPEPSTPTSTETPSPTPTETPTPTPTPEPDIKIIRTGFEDKPEEVICPEVVGAETNYVVKVIAENTADEKIRTTFRAILRATDEDGKRKRFTASRTLNMPSGRMQAFEITVPVLCNINPENIEEPEVIVIQR